MVLHIRKVTVRLFTGSSRPSVMKKFFAKASKPFTPASSSPITARLFNSTFPHTTVRTGLDPDYVLPPVPYPRPYNHLALLVTDDGLLVRPHIPGSSLNQSIPYSCVRLTWGKGSRVEEIEKQDDNLDWTESVIVYGIAGVLELFTCAWFFVILR